MVGSVLAALAGVAGLLLRSESVYGLPFVRGRYDVGNKLDYLRATVELALERDDLGSEFRRYLSELVRREGLV